MEAYPRRKSILALLKESGEVRIDDLVRRFGVSANSIRTDLTEMEETGRLRRIRGGAVAVERPDQEADPRAVLPAPVPNRYEKEQRLHELRAGALRRAIA